MFSHEISGLIENIANGDLGDANTSYTYVFFTEGDFKKASFFFDAENTTVTIEATLDDNSIGNDSADWRDVTAVLFGIASATTGEDWIIDDTFPAARLRFKRVTTDGTNSFSLRAAKSAN